METRGGLALKSAISYNKQKLEHLSRLCASLSPSAPLNKGFALIRKDGKIIQANDKILENESFELIRKNEIVTSKALAVKQI